MRVIALVENTSISKDYKSKHGLCLYIETKKHKLEGVSKFSPSFLCPKPRLSQAGALL